MLRFEKPVLDPENTVINAPASKNSCNNWVYMRLPLDIQLWCRPLHRCKFLDQGRIIETPQGFFFLHLGFGRQLEPDTIDNVICQLFHGGTTDEQVTFIQQCIYMLLKPE